MSTRIGTDVQSVFTSNVGGLVGNYRVHLHARIQKPIVCFPVFCWQLGATRLGMRLLMVTNGRHQPVTHTTDIRI
jgi:hypothetical protein